MASDTGDDRRALLSQRLIDDNVDGNGLTVAGCWHPRDRPPEAGSTPAAGGRFGDYVGPLATGVSLTANLLLAAAKGLVYWVSHSQAVLASLADSVVDITSQVIVFVCQMKMARIDPRYPVGKARLETVAAILSASVMTLGAVEVIQSAAKDLIAGLRGIPPKLSLGLSMYVILLSAILVKLVLFVFCFVYRHRSAAILVLAEDHRNDVISNTAAVIAAFAAHENKKRLWWIDPAAGVIISLYIVLSWMRVAAGQIDKIVGLGAPNEFIERLKILANENYNDLEVDVIRAYHFGQRYFVEIDLVFPRDMSVAESHDVAVLLQRQVEAMEEVERAFVHVDYEKRAIPEHKTDWVFESQSGRHSTNSRRFTGSVSGGSVESIDV